MYSKWALDSYGEKVVGKWAGDAPQKKELSGQDFRTLIDEIRRDMNRGVLTYDEARAKAQPIIDEMNAIARGVAAKYGKKHHDFTFISLMR